MKRNPAVAFFRNDVAAVAGGNKMRNLHFFLERERIVYQVRHQIPLEQINLMHLLPCRSPRKTHYVHQHNQFFRLRNVRHDVRKRFPKVQYFLSPFFSPFVHTSSIPQFPRFSKAIHTSRFIPIHPHSFPFIRVSPCLPHDKIPLPVL